jgi:hypothetical protein
MKEWQPSEAGLQSLNEREAAKDAFIKRKMAEENISEAQWQSLSYDEKLKLQEKWRRVEERGSDYLLEQRLQKLVGKTIKSFEVGSSGDIEFVFEDGAKLSFTSWSARDDRPDYDGVEVETFKED